MQQTLSATPLEAVHVEQRGEIADVWLHRNIVHDWRDLPDGSSQEFWGADEVYGTMPAGTTADEVAADFDRLWMRFDNSGLSDREYAELTAKAAAVATESIIGATTGSTAPGDIETGELFIASGTAYVAINNIARGETLTEGVNVSKTTVAEYIMAQARDKE